MIAAGFNYNTFRPLAQMAEKANENGEIAP
jgi:hypothetical protein